MDWNFEYGGAVPRLPRPIRVSQESDPDEVRPETELLQAGCWQLLLAPIYPKWIQDNYHPGMHYEGTLRVEWGTLSESGQQILGSGDLYVVRRGHWSDISEPPAPKLVIKKGIPVFPRRDYRYYLRLEDMGSGGDELKLKLELNRFSLRNGWVPSETLIASIKKDSDGTESVILAGNVINPDQDEEVAKLVLGHVSSFLRRAKVEMDKVQSVRTFPLNNGDKENWNSVFERAGWQVTPVQSEEDIPDLGRPWVGAELHGHMLSWRDKKEEDLDGEWYYHLLCVGEIDGPLRFGWMYDSEADQNGISREGAAMAGLAKIPCEDPWPKKIQGKEIQEVPEVYFRTAVHEVAHAMGLYHNHKDLGIMQSTHLIAAQDSSSFPSNIKWDFAPDDARRLRHLPDPWVRPGGLDFGFRYPFGPVPVDDLTVETGELRLYVVPMEKRLVFGTPLRVILVLKNESRRCLRVPKRIDFASGRVVGRVIEPFRGEHPFWGVYRYWDLENGFRDLGPGQCLVHSETLLYGHRGALFPAPGVYRVEIDLAWEPHLGRVKVAGSTEVIVLPPRFRCHATAAQWVISTPQLMDLLVFGTSVEQLGKTSYAAELEKAGQALRKALCSRILRPHFAMIQARVLAAKGDLPGAARWIDSSSRLSGTEIGGLAWRVENAEPKDRDHPRVRRLIRICRRQLRKLKKCKVPVESEAEERVERLYGQLWEPR